jgi:hypothetical protein
MRIVLVVIGLAAILVAGCVSSGAASPEPTEQPSSSPVPTSLGTPAPTTVPTPSPVPLSSPTPSTPEPSIKPLASPLPIGLIAVTLADDGLRVRSRPWVGDDSINYEPLLPNGTGVHILEGPVVGSGYWWYRVELDEGVTLLDGVREGWVAVADHDGTPWVGPLIEVLPGPPPPSPVTGWPIVRRGLLSMHGSLDQEESQGSSLAIRVEVGGLLPGQPVNLTATGSYAIEWWCGPGSRPAEGLDPGAPFVSAGGRATTEARGTVGSDGIAVLSLVLPAAPPAEPCPSENPGPLFAPGGRWDGVEISDTHRGLVLGPATYEWQDTF